MFHLTRRAGGVLAITMAGLMTLMGCGPATPTTAPPTVTKPAGGPTATPVAGATASPTVPKVAAVEGGTFNEFNASDPITFNTFQTSLSVAQHQIHLTHSDLIRHCSLQLPDTGTVPGSGALCPNLASSWEVTNGGKTWTFHLVKNATFPNVAPMNGRALTAKDALYTWTQARDNPATVFKAYFTNITDMQAPDDNTFVMTTSVALPDFGQTVGNGDEFPGMVAPEYAASLGTQYGTGQDSLMDGTGPFVPAGGTKGSQWLLNKNPKYFLSGLGGMKLPHVDADRVLIIPDATAREAAFVTGQLDTFAPPAPAKQNASRIMAQKADIAQFVTLGLTGDSGGMMLNQGGMLPTATGNPAFKDVRVRQALQLLYPFPHIMKDYFGADTVSNYDGCTPSGFTLYSLTQDELAKLYPYDPAKAKQLLTEAGYSTSKHLVVEEMEWTGYNQAALDFDQAFKAETDATGMIDWTLAPLPLANGRALLVKGQFQVVISPQGSGGPDKTIQPFHTGAAQNYMEWSDPKADAWIDDESTQFDQAKRVQDFKEFNRYCATQAPKIPSPTTAGYGLQRGWVKNYGLADPVYINELRNQFVWIDKTGISGN